MYHLPPALTVFDQLASRETARAILAGRFPLSDIARASIASRAGILCSRTYRADMGAAREAHIADCMVSAQMARWMRADLDPAFVVQQLFPADFE
jgi:hypothetical protein